MAYTPEDKRYKNFNIGIEGMPVEKSAKQSEEIDALVKRFLADEGKFQEKKWKENNGGVLHTETVIDSWLSFETQKITEITQARDNPEELFGRELSEFIKSNSNLASILRKYSSKDVDALSEPSALASEEQGRLEQALEQLQAERQKLTPSASEVLQKQELVDKIQAELQGLQSEAKKYNASQKLYAEALPLVKLKAFHKKLTEEEEAQLKKLIGPLSLSKTALNDPDRAPEVLTYVQELLAYHDKELNGDSASGAEGLNNKIRRRNNELAEAREDLKQSEEKASEEKRHNAEELVTYNQLIDDTNTALNENTKKIYTLGDVVADEKRNEFAKEVKKKDVEQELKDVSKFYTENNLGNTPIYAVKVGDTLTLGWDDSTMPLKLENIPAPSFAGVLPLGPLGVIRVGPVTAGSNAGTVVRAAADFLGIKKESVKVSVPGVSFNRVDLDILNTFEETWKRAAGDIISFIEKPKEQTDSIKIGGVFPTVVIDPPTDGTIDLTEMKPPEGYKESGVRPVNIQPVDFDGSNPVPTKGARYIMNNSTSGGAFTFSLMRGGSKEHPVVLSIPLNTEVNATNFRFDNGELRLHLQGEAVITALNLKSDRTLPVNVAMEIRGDYGNTERVSLVEA